MSKVRCVAIGGIFSALSIIIIFMSLFMPLTYLWVALSGFPILLIVIEAGRKTAFCAYIGVTLLCFVLIPNMLRTVEFALFIGFYPIIKMKLDSLDRTWFRRVIKLVLFFVCAVVNLTISVHMLGVSVAFEHIHIAVPVGAMMISYIGYDYLLAYFYHYYVTKLRSKIMTHVSGK